MHYIKDKYHNLHLIYTVLNSAEDSQAQVFYREKFKSKFGQIRD